MWDGVASHTVRIQELIYLHALLLEMRQYLEQESDVPYSAFDGYDSQPTRPTHIHRNKDAHKNAINLLLNGFEQCVQTHPPPDHTLPS